MTRGAKANAIEILDAPTAVVNVCIYVSKLYMVYKIHNNIGPIPKLNTTGKQMFLLLIQTSLQAVDTLNTKSIHQH